MSRKKIAFIALFVLSLAACSQEKEAARAPNSTIGPVQEDAISNTVLKNCRFQNPTPVYAYKSNIAPNPIICDEGLATKVELLTPSPLPSGISFSKNEMSLVGIANEKVKKAPYKYYIENEAGYAILNLKITIE